MTDTPFLSLQNTPVSENASELMGFLLDLAVHLGLTDEEARQADLSRTLFSPKLS